MSAEHLIPIALAVAILLGTLYVLWRYDHRHDVRSRPLRWSSEWTKRQQRQELWDRWEPPQRSSGPVQREDH